MAPACRRPIVTSSSCRTTRRRAGAAALALRSSGGSSWSTAAGSRSATRIPRERRLPWNCRRPEHVSMSTILIVDDEAGVRSSLAAVLRDEGYSVETSESGEACLARTIHETPDVILLDIWLPGIDGLATLERLRERRVDAEVIMISGHASVEAAVRATKLGAFDFIEKPLSIDKTVLAVRNALRQRRLEVENRQLRARVDRRLVIVGASVAMEQL